jgi:hypothetical protein
MSDRKMDAATFNAVCLEIESNYKGISSICKEHNSSASAFYDWMEANTEAAERYARAKDRQADYLADLMLEEAFNDADDTIPFVGVNHIQRDRLKVDTLKFIAAKLKPKKYGDKIDVTSDGKEIKTTTIINLGSGIKPD